MNSWLLAIQNNSGIWSSQDVVLLIQLVDFEIKIPHITRHTYTKLPIPSLYRCYRERKAREHAVSNECRVPNVANE